MKSGAAHGQSLPSFFKGFAIAFAPVMNSFATDFEFCEARDCASKIERTCQRLRHDSDGTHFFTDNTTLYPGLNKENFLPPRQDPTIERERERDWFGSCTNRNIRLN